MTLCISVSPAFEIIVQDEKQSKEYASKRGGDVCQPISLKGHFLIEDGSLVLIWPTLREPYIP